MLVPILTSIIQSLSWIRGKGIDSCMLLSGFDRKTGIIRIKSTDRISIFDRTERKMYKFRNRPGESKRKRNRT